MRPATYMTHKMVQVAMMSIPCRSASPPRTPLKFYGGPLCPGGHRGSDGGAGDAAPGGGVAKPAAGRRRGDGDDGAGRAARPKTPGGGAPDPPLGAT